MGAKAVYNCLTLAIYITRPDLQNLLKQEARLIPVYLGQSKEPVGNIHIIIEPVTARILEQMCAIELEVIEKGKETWLKERLGARKKQKDQKNGK